MQQAFSLLLHCKKVKKSNSHIIESGDATLGSNFAQREQKLILGIDGKVHPNIKSNKC